MHLDSAVLAGFAVSALDVQVGYRKPNGTVYLAVRETPLRNFAADARFRYTPSETEVQYDSLNLRIDTTLWRAAHPASVVWGTAGVRINNVELNAGRNGHITVDGLLAAHPGSGDGLHAVIQNLELADLAALAQQDVAVTGLLSLQADMVGDTRHPLAPRNDGDLECDDPRIAAAESFPQLPVRHDAVAGTRRVGAQGRAIHAVRRRRRDAC